MTVRAAEAHRLRLIQQETMRPGSRRVAHRIVRPGVDQREHVERDDAAVFGKANFHASRQAGTSAPDEVLFFAR